MDIEEAVRAAIAIKPRVVIRMHRSKANPQDFKKKKAAFDRFSLKKMLDHVEGLLEKAAGLH